MILYTYKNNSSRITFYIDAETTIQPGETKTSTTKFIHPLVPIIGQEEIPDPGGGGGGGVGPAGPQGPAGADGMSAYQIAVRNGFKGSEADWLASLKGEPGPAGPTGPTGPQGPAGNDGEPGATGATGPTGPQGPAGNDGAAGAPGAAGADGKSAFQIAQDNGFEGDEAAWLASLKGAKGDPGTPAVDADIIDGNIPTGGA